MSPASPARPFRVVTYNVHGCVGGDFRRSETRVAEVLAELEPDIVGLQELDLGRRRSGGADQAGLIAERLGLRHFFHPAMRRGDEHYGDAILSRWPMTVQRAGELPSEKAFLFRETRGALWVEIATPHGIWHVMNTHFGLGRAERLEQAEALLGSDWLGAVPAGEPLLVLGDLNSLPQSATCALLRSRLQEAGRASGKGGGAATFPTLLPLLQLDYVFTNDRVNVEELSVWRTPLARRASDHFPVLALINRKAARSEKPPDALSN